MPAKGLRRIIKRVDFFFPLNRDYYKLEPGFRFPEDAVCINATFEALHQELKELEERIIEIKHTFEANAPITAILGTILGPEIKR